MPFFDSNGVRIHYEEHGQGAPVILIHGFGTHETIGAKPG
jgi:pimeloyl-ACP methyl ester carboxylesterase